jgi:hypothetical protein
VCKSLHLECVLNLGIWTIRKPRVAIPFKFASVFIFTFAFVFTFVFMIMFTCACTNDEREPTDMEHRQVVYT